MYNQIARAAIELPSIDRHLAPLIFSFADNREVKDWPEYSSTELPEPGGLS